MALAAGSAGSRGSGGRWTPTRACWPPRARCYAACCCGRKGEVGGARGVGRGGRGGEEEGGRVRGGGTGHASRHT